MCTYLDQVGATYYFRRAVLDDFRGILTTRTVAQGLNKDSLRTNDRETAKQLIPAHTVETDQPLAEARSGMTSPAPFKAPVPSITNRAAWITERQQAGIDQAKREDLADAIEFLKARLAGSTERMSPEMRAMRFLRDDAARLAENDVQMAGQAGWRAYPG